MTGLSDNIELLFMRLGHKRCSVDEYFSLLKQCYRSTNVAAMEDFSTVINSSYKANCVTPFTWEWRMLDNFLSQMFKPIVGIRKYQHFQVSSSEPGVVHAKHGCFDMEDGIRLIKEWVSIIGSQRLKSVAATGISDLQKQITPYLTQTTIGPW